MTSPIHQPHDKLFKLSMGDIRVARDFFESHLPADILQHVALDTLKLEKHSFIDEAFKSTEADVVYSVKQGTETAYFYLLCENQSEVDSMIVFRLLVSKVRLMELHYKQQPLNPLPMVYAMVVYTGESEWDAPSDIVDLLPEPKKLARDVFFRPYQLIDLQRMSDDDIRKHNWSGLVEFALKYRRRRELASHFFQIILPWLDQAAKQDGLNLSRIVLKYVLDGMDYNVVSFEKQVKQYLSSSELRGDAMTLAQQYEQRGEQRGRVEKSFEIAKRLLSKGQDVNFIAEITGLSIAEINELNTKH